MIGIPGRACPGVGKAEIEVAQRHATLVPLSLPGRPPQASTSLPP